MTGERLVEVCPSVYHMAAEGAWPSIQRHGLLSTQALLDLFDITGLKRERALGARRSMSETIRHVQYGEAVIRDQRPMSDNGLRRCLPNSISPEDWYRLLNRKVFFWATLERLETLLNGKAYRDRSHTIIRINTAALVSRYQRCIKLTTMNTGTTKPMPHPRDYSSFVDLAHFDYEASRRKRGRARAIAEVTVEWAVRDVSEMVSKVEERGAHGVTRMLYED